MQHFGLTIVIRSWATYAQSFSHVASFIYLCVAKKVEKSVIIMAKIQIKYDKYTAFSFYLENQRKAWRVVEKIVLLSAKACYEPKKNKTALVMNLKK